VALGAQLPSQGPDRDQSVPQALAVGAFVLAAVILAGWWFS
jgi:hypothetical protein